MPVGLHGCCVCVGGLLDASKATFFRLRQGLTGFISARRVVQQPGGGGGWSDVHGEARSLVMHAAASSLFLCLAFPSFTPGGRRGRVSAL